MPSRHPLTWWSPACHHRRLSMQQALNRALGEVLADNPKALIFGEDCGRLGGVFRITDGLQAKHGDAARL